MIVCFGNRAKVATLFICIVLLYISFTFNSCFIPKIRQTLHQVRCRDLKSILKFKRILTKYFKNLFKVRLKETSEYDIKSLSNTPSEVLEIQLIGSIVRNIPLTGTNEIDIMPKYRLLSEEGEQLSRHLPEVLIIGVKKSGTRALLEFIRLHPDVRAAGCEVHFFDRHYNRGLHWYRNHMPPTMTGQLSLEKTPSYFVTKEVPFRVHHMNPSTKYIK